MLALERPRDKQPDMGVHRTGGGGSGHQSRSVYHYLLQDHECSSLRPKLEEWSFVDRQRKGEARRTSLPVFPQHSWGMHSLHFSCNIGIVMAAALIGYDQASVVAWFVM